MGTLRTGDCAFWTPAKVEEVTRLWTEGLSGQQIADMIGAVSRSSVIGKVYRLGLPKRGPEVKRLNNDCRNIERRTRPKRLPIRPPTKELPMMSPVSDASFAKPWLERRFGECAYPISGEGADTFSCCAPSGDLKYCPSHRKVMIDWSGTAKANRKRSRLAA